MWELYIDGLFSYKELILKGDAKFKEKLTLGLKNDKNLVNFLASCRKSENLHFDGLPLSKTYKDLDEKVQKSYISWYWRTMQSLKKKLALGFKNDIRNLVNFNASSGKSENLQFDVLLLSIAYKVLTKKVQKNYLSWHRRMIQTLKKNWLFVWKMIWGIWWILTRAVESLKICTLMGYFCRRYVVFELKKYRRVVSWKTTYDFKNVMGISWIFTTTFASSWK